MSDNEIIKALECCKDLNCSECPKKTNLFETDCDVQLCDEVLNLINRQKADIEKKDIEIDILIRKKEALNDEISDLKAEIEETQKNSETLAIALIKAKAEIGQLQQKYELSEAEREANVKGFTETLETVKAEAIKEFAERLKSTMFNEDFLLCEPCDMANIIDNLVKEMTENQ